MSKTRLHITNDASSSKAASLLMILCDAMRDSEGRIHREFTEIALELAEQVSREWVSCVRSFIKKEQE